MHVRMIQDFHVDLEKTGSFLTYPAGWVGEMSEEHADLALAAKAAERSTTFAGGLDEEVDAAAMTCLPEDAELEKLTREQLDALAAGRQIDTSGAKTKADVIALLKPARVEGDLDRLTLEQLSAMAVAREIAVAEGSTKADLITLLTPAA